MTWSVHGFYLLSYETPLGDDEATSGTQLGALAIMPHHPHSIPEVISLEKKSWNLYTSATVNDSTYFISGH